MTRSSPAGLAYVALGSNLGAREKHLARGVALLAGETGVRVLRASPVYETAAHTLVPGDEQPAYLNAVVEVATTLSPARLMEVLLGVEQRLGREREAGRRWAPRTLDLDLIVYDRVMTNDPGLVLPHPRMAERRFVLRPLADLAPNLLVPPPFDAPVSVLLAECPDSSVPARTAHALLTPDEGPDHV